MNRQIAAAAVVAFIVAFALGSFFGGRGDAAVAPTTTTGATSLVDPPAEPVFVQPGETVIGPAVVIAKDLRLDGNQVVLEFELESLAPVGDAATITDFLSFQATESIPPQDLATVYLDGWVLETTAGDIPGTSANPAARTARFEVDSGFSLDTITSVRLASYALLVPIRSEFVLDVGSDTAIVAPGITARLLAVTEQAVTIVQVEVISERDFNYDNITVLGAGPGWKSAVREAEGRPRWNLTYESPTAPSPIPLEIAGSVWVSLDTDTPVLLEAAG